MRIIAIFLGAALFLLIFYFLGGFKWISEEMFQPDQNPELVSYLQGDWTVANDNKSVFRIQRDSLFEISNDSMTSATSLEYLFYEAASKYYTKDSSFDFSSSGKRGLSMEFKLRQVEKKSHDTIMHILVYVSRSRVEMMSRGRTRNLSRLK